MIKLSTGVDSTLGNYRDLAASFFGEASSPTKFLDAKIAAYPNGREGEVIAAETQMVRLLTVMFVTNPEDQK